MKLLVSAYACSPNRGSEHGSAWNWITGASRLGHEIWALVAPNHRDAIIRASGVDPAAAAVRWVFPEVGGWPLEQSKEPKWERTYNLLWQRQALRAARGLAGETRFDLVHHLTWGGIRAPTFLGGLGVPLVMGPLGGGEVAPKSLRDRFPPRGRLMETLRDLSNATILLNPLVRRGLGDAAVIFARTADTRDVVGARYRDKTRVLMELGITASQIGAPRTASRAPRRLLYAGRLLYWKGVHILISSMAELVARMPDAHLTIVGSGPEEHRLRGEAARLKLDANIDFVPWLPQAEFMRLYDQHDIFVFPSLHDSTGWVVLESFCRGLPVVCFDLGGPKDIVTPEAGVVVPTDGCDSQAAARRLGDALLSVLSDSGRPTALSAGAVARARDFLLSERISRLYDEAREVIERDAKYIPCSSLAWYDRGTAVSSRPPCNFDKTGKP